MPVLARPTIRWIMALLAAVALALALPALHAANAAPGGAPSGAQVVPLHGTPVLATGAHQAPPTYAQCEAALGVPCYSPQLIRQAYGMNGLLRLSDGGRGQTIVIIDSYGSPTVAADLAQFDADFGLPAPPSLRVLAPFGSVPFDPNGPDELGWAEETSLDVQWSHAMAPNASIVLLTSPVDETQGVQGMPQFLQLEEYAVQHHLGKIISQSWATTENTLFTPAGEKLMAQFNDFYRWATTTQGVTFLGSTGDAGTANPDVAGDIYPFPTVNFPATSPWVTAVGGTSLYTDANGNYQSETVWNDQYGATGGGISQQTREPFYQYLLPRSVQQQLGGHRGIPDVSFNADPATPVLVYLGFLGGVNNGYYLFGGTSEGSPSWAGIVADLNSYLHHPMGFLNPTLYTLGAVHALYPSPLRDVTTGTNGGQDGIAGYSAGPGWDPATGLGTPNMTVLAHSIWGQQHRAH